MSTPFTITAPVIGHFDAKGIRHQNSCVEDASGCFRASGPGDGLRIRRAIMSEGACTEMRLSVGAVEAVRDLALTQEIQIDLPWSSYVIAPGAVYDGNRFLVLPQAYCPEPPTDGMGADGPILVVDIPRLTADTGYRIDLASNVLTTPFVGIFDPLTGKGALIELEIYGAWGVSGFELITLPGESIMLRLHLPVMRRRRYKFCDWSDVEEKGLSMEAGDEFETTLRVHSVTAGGIPDFISKLNKRAFDARDRGEGKWHQRLAAHLREAGDLVEAKFDKHNWNEAKGVYQNTPLRQKNPTHLLQTGWAGGGMVAVAMLRSHSADRRSRARRMLDVICAEALSPSGHFFDYLLPDGTWGGFSSKWPGRRPYLFMRRTLECTRDVIKAMELLRERGEPVPESWQSAARRSLKAIVKTTERHGQLGYLVDPANGDVLLGASTCGGFALEALVRGHAWFEDARYLETATRLARFYRERYLLAGYTCGGVADALMSVDSESNYGLLSGLVHLHEATQDPEHLAWAVEAAELFQTWVLLYDAVLPQGTPLQRLGIQPRGAVFANIQNQHGAPGIFVFSGHELAILAERTGDERWRILLREIVACIPQMVVREGQSDVWGDLPPGSSSERLMTMDGLEPAGCTAQIDTFSQVVLISANELPPEVLS